MSRSTHTHLTQRAADGGDSAASRSIFYALSFFCPLDSSTPAPRPPLTQAVGLPVHSHKNNTRDSNE
ncbi:MAG: hypothetical protein LC115_08095 [Bacteroidia bacterium]|nr:hypothetical protein [Bacteroidia bacterium]